MMFSIRSNWLFSSLLAALVCLALPGSRAAHAQEATKGLSPKEANRLPAPEGPFVLTLRAYWPNTTPLSILDGSWQPPGMVRIERLAK
jgi:hypothetical protein